MSLRHQENSKRILGHPISNNLGQELINQFIKVSSTTSTHSIAKNLTAKGIKFPTIIIDVVSFRGIFKPELGDFIFLFFAIINNDLVILFKKEYTYDNNGNRIADDCYYKIDNKGGFNLITKSDAENYIDIYVRLIGSKIGYTKYLWSEFTNEMDAYYIASNVSEWEIQFGYVDKGIIPIPPASSPLLSNYEKNYLNNYHDHLTAVSIIKTSSGSTEYRDADNICPPRCIV